LKCLRIAQAIQGSLSVEDLLIALMFMTTELLLSETG